MLTSIITDVEIDAETERTVTGDELHRHYPVRFNPDGIPQELKDQNLWVGYRAQTKGNPNGHKPGKVPVHPVHGYRMKDVTKGYTFAAVTDNYNHDTCLPPGYAFLKENRIIGIDIDNCRDPETREIDNAVRTILALLDTYAEVSASGRGIKALCHGRIQKLSIKDNITLNIIGKQVHTEIYTCNRRFSLTGNRVDGMPKTLSERTDEIDQLLDMRASTRAAGTNAPRGWAGVTAILNLPPDDADRGDNTLTRLIGLLGLQGVSEDAIATLCHLWNRESVNPMDDETVQRKVRQQYERYDYKERAIVEPKFVSAEELKMRPPSTVRWLVPGIVPEGVVMVVGRPKSGKSWLALQLAVAAATGGKAFGEAVTQGDVLYISLDDTENRMKNRQEQVRGGENSKPRLTYLFECARDDAGGRQTIENWLEQHPEAALVVIDMFVQYRPKIKGSGQDYNQDYEALMGLKQITRKHPGLTVLVTHHTRKMAGDNILDEISGTTGIAGAIDAGISIKRDALATTGVLLGMGKEYTDPPNFPIELNNDPVEWVLHEQAFTPFDVLTAEQRAMVVALTEMGGRGNSEQLASHIGKSAVTVRIGMAKVVEAGLAAKKEGRGGGYQLVNQTGV